MTRGIRPVRAAVALGANVGNRLRALRRAVRALAGIPGTRLDRMSRIYRTAPVGPVQRDFLNAAVVLRTTLGPEALLERLRAAERALGRRARRRWGPREIDLDLILYGGRRLRGRALTVPHPRWRERRFVLEPLAEVAPRWRDPVSGRTVAHFRRKLTGSGQSIRLYPSTIS